MKWILRGREYLEKDDSFIIVSNHQSSLDILGIFDIWAIMDKCTVVAKKELFYAWPFGLAAWLAGLIFIDRMNSEKARKTMQDAAESVKAKRGKVMITALPPISTQGMTSNDVDKLIEHTRDVMIKTFHETSKQVAISHNVTQ
ncbi:1-acyl-sn-glycerol-3-phosphate acyltransferase [Holotrichia oblita]|uniref:1-acyl-sn-glycerol-3-phosphate acyltransferase n=1 Tax=Holotrichia oblita TaxID=644536 RepID=A0ACB9SQJ4_HOLOL|nr:1-acyl-sn-glycerol-3-phosphate acyltransferase [Holotrichia oblita]